MEWKDLGATLGKFAPLIGTAIGGPAGRVIGGVVAEALGVANTPDAVSEALKINPDVAVKLAQLEADQRVQLQTLVVTAEQNRLSAETAQLTSVNTTMQAEAVAEHWPTYAWRPFIGFVFGTMMLGVYFVLPLLHIAVPPIPTEAWLAIGAILGVASWHRGAMQANPAIPSVNRG
jgi:hypothetical protein